MVREMDETDIHRMFATAVSEEKLSQISSESAKKIRALSVDEFGELFNNLTSKVEELPEKLKAVRDNDAKTHEELEAQTKLADSYKSKSVKNKERSEELTKAVTEHQTRLRKVTNKYRDLKTKHKEMQLSNEEIVAKKNERIAMLKQELETRDESVQKEVEGISPAAAPASRLIKSGMSLTQICKQCLNLSNELTHEKEHCNLLRSYISNLRLKNRQEEKAKATKLREREVQVRKDSQAEILALQQQLKTAKETGKQQLKTLVDEQETSRKVIEDKLKKRKERIKILKKQCSDIQSQLTIEKCLRRQLNRITKRLEIKSEELEKTKEELSKVREQATKLAEEKNVIEKEADAKTETAIRKVVKKLKKCIEDVTKEIGRVEQPSNGPAQESGTSSISSKTVTTTQAGLKRPREVETDSCQLDEQGKLQQQTKRTRVQQGATETLQSHGTVTDSGLEVEYQVPASSQRDHEEDTDAVIVFESDEDGEGPDEGEGDDDADDPDTEGYDMEAYPEQELNYDDDADCQDMEEEGRRRRRKRRRSSGRF